MRKEIKSRILRSAAASAACFTVGMSILPAQKPNVVLLLADDLGYADIGCYGNKNIHTPNIDRLYRQGVHFTSFYVNSAESTPTRAALLTGRYQQRAGGLECALGAGNVGRYDEAVWLSEKGELGLPAEDCTLPLTLKKAGYNTAMFGKWHLGYEKKFRPDSHGFDYSLGPIGYGGDYFYHTEQAPINQPDFKGFSGTHVLAENGREIFREGEYMTDLLSKEAVKWINKQDDKSPFFLYMAWTSPHAPYQGPRDRLERPLTEKEWNNSNPEVYKAMIESLDEGIGRLLSALENKGLAKNTIVIFLSDNGGTKAGSNGSLSGFKAQLYEGGIRVPCIIRWPGKIKENSVSEQVAIGFDLSRSIINLSGTNTKGIRLDGYDIIAHVTKNLSNIDRNLCWRYRRGYVTRKAARSGDFKYLIEYKDKAVTDEKLYNIKEDPSEKNDLLTSMPDKRANIRKMLDQWEKDVESPRLAGFKK
jgi:N-acetylgalactosamine-6-sulfatase